MGRSSYAVTGTVDEVSRSLNHEIKEVFTRIHQVKMRLIELKKIRLNLVTFVDSVFQECKGKLIKYNTYNIGGESTIQQFDHFIETRVIEAKAIIDLEYLVAKEKIMLRRRQLAWDIGKIAITAIVGGFLGAFLKTLFP